MIPIAAFSHGNDVVCLACEAIDAESYFPIAALAPSKVGHIVDYAELSHPRQMPFPQRSGSLSALQVPAARSRDDCQSLRCCDKAVSRPAGFCLRIRSQLVS